MNTFMLGVGVATSAIGVAMLNSLSSASTIGQILLALFGTIFALGGAMISVIAVQR